MLLQLAWEGSETSWWFFGEVNETMIRYAFITYIYYVYYMFGKTYITCLVFLGMFWAWYSLCTCDFLRLDSKMFCVIMDSGL